MKSVLTKRSIRWNWWGSVLVGYFIVAGGVYTMLQTALRRLPPHSVILGVLMGFFGVVLINHAALARGQREIKKSITDLKEKIGELGKKK